MNIKEKRADQSKRPVFKEELYPIYGSPRGHCLIVDNEIFNHNDKRDGTQVDSWSLCSLFSQLNIEVTVARNLKKKEFKDRIKQFAVNNDRETGSVCVLAVLSHGNETSIACADDKLLEKEWLLKQFNNADCKGLHGKPKFFIFQACRGFKSDAGLNPQSGKTDNMNGKLNTGQSLSSHPSWKDCLIANSTVYGYVSYLHAMEGSIFIQSLCKVFMENASDTDIRDMLDMVTVKMQSKGITEGYLQTPSYENRGFVKKLYFNPTGHQAAIHFEKHDPPAEEDPPKANQVPMITNWFEQRWRYIPSLCLVVGLGALALHYV